MYAEPEEVMAARRRVRDLEKELAQARRYLDRLEGLKEPEIYVRRGPQREDEPPMYGLHPAND